MMYHEFLKTKSATRKKFLKKTLLDYAAEDVQNLRILKGKLSKPMQEGIEL
jgi:uncharacterized protein YprB with RNaseH-like and TPR domain